MEPNLNPRIMFFLYFLTDQNPLLGLFFQKFTPSLKIVTEFENLQDKEGLTKFYEKMYNEVVPHTPYLDRVQIANFFFYIYNKDEESFKELVPRLLRLNDDWKDDVEPLSGFMFYNEISETNIDKMKQICLKRSYHIFYIFKKFYKEKSLSDFIMSKREIVEFLQDMRNKNYRFKNRLSGIEEQDEDVP